MKRALTYRLLVLGMATVFVVFNVGIPVVVAACPMTPDSRTMRCDACATPGGNAGESMSTNVDRSCCATVFAALPSSATFLKAQAAGFAEEFVVIALVPYAAAAGASLTGFVRTVRADRGTKPPSDLPILFSSLLI